MKTLLILRHGKAESYHEDGDKSRQLAERGLRDAKRMGELVLKETGTPDLVVSSDASRARQTAVIAAQAAGYSGKIQYRSEIYEASVRTLLAVIASLPETASKVLIVGHNPGFEDLVSDISSDNSSVGALPTAGLAIVDFNLPWQSVVNGSGKLRSVFVPKGL